MRRCTFPVRAAGALLLAAAASGCGLRPISHAVPGEPRLYTSFDLCPNEVAGPESAALVTALITGVASQLLNRFGTALDEGSKGGALPSVVATRNLDLARGRVPTCVVYARGSFDRVAPDDTSVSWPKLLGIDPDDPESKRRADALGFDPAYRVDQLIELRVMASKGDQALTFAPLRLHLARSIDGARDGERDLTVALRFNRVGEEGTGSVAVIPNQAIGRSQPALERHRDGHYPREAPWFASFHPAAAVAGPGGSAGGPMPLPGSVATPVPGGASTIPVTLTATVVETRPTNEGLAFISAVFSKIKPSLEEALKK